MMIPRLSAGKVEIYFKVMIFNATVLCYGKGIICFQAIKLLFAGDTGYLQLFLNTDFRRLISLKLKPFTIDGCRKLKRAQLVSVPGKISVFTRSIRVISVPVFPGIKKGLSPSNKPQYVFNSNCLVSQCGRLPFPGCWWCISPTQILSLYKPHCAPYMVKLNTLNALIAFAC